MKIACISDIHLQFPLIHDDFPIVDVLVCAGDITNRGDLYEIDKFFEYINKSTLHILHKITIAGNHDFGFQKKHKEAKAIANKHGWFYLEDTEKVIQGVKFYGSPWQPWFYDWAFNLPRNGEDLKEKWDRIPKDTDVLITHGPAFGILDRTREGLHVGCELLAPRVLEVKPKLHVFGHIHESYGVVEKQGTIYANASICNRSYDPVNPPIIIDI